MRKIGRHRRKKQKKLLIIVSLSLLLFLCVGYAAFSTSLTITARGNIKENTRVIQAWSSTDQTDFHSDFYKENIVSVTFLDNNNVPDNATESWNVSEDKENGIVMAWVVPNNDDNTKYDLYIGARGGVIANEDSSNIFNNFIEIQFIDFGNNFDTSNVINMYGMFLDCQNVEYINLKNFITNNVTNMHDMFRGCYNLKELDLSSFNTSNVTTMLTMFQDCQTLQSLNLESFDTSKVTIMRGMFARCSNLSILDISSFDTRNVTSMRDMFLGCSSLKELDLANFNTTNVEDFRGIFWECTELVVLDLCSFDTSKAIDMSAMFYLDSKIYQIKVGPNWITDNADTTNMFAGTMVSSVTTGQC